MDKKISLYLLLLATLTEVVRASGLPGDTQGALPDQNTAQFYIDRAYDEWYIGDNKKALKDLNYAVKLEPGNAATYAARAELKYKQLQYFLCILDYGRALKKNCLNPEYYYKRGLAKYESDHYVRAISDFSKAIALNPKYAEAYQKKAEAETWLSRFEKADADSYWANRCEDGKIKVSQGP
jgi:tetratricopeptide (TPR) repeat protein